MRAGDYSDSGAWRSVKYSVAAIEELAAVARSAGMSMDISMAGR